MAQLGFHALIGVGLGRLLAPGPAAPVQPAEGRGGRATPVMGTERARATSPSAVAPHGHPSASAGGASSAAAGEDPAGNLRWGLVVGSILPDADLFLLGPLYLFNQSLAMGMHRTFTHSLVSAAVVLAFFWVRSGSGRERALWSLGCGVSIGLAVHALVDLVIWFSGVDLLWPLGWLGLPSYVNVWEGYQTSPLVPKLLGAADYLAFALFYAYLRGRARTLGTDADFLPQLTRRLQASAALWVAYTALAFTGIGPSLFDIVHYAVFIVVFLPWVLHTTWRMRRTLSAPWPAPAAATGQDRPAQQV